MANRDNPDQSFDVEYVGKENEQRQQNMRTMRWAKITFTANDVIFNEVPPDDRENRRFRLLNWVVPRQSIVRNSIRENQDVNGRNIVAFDCTCGTFYIFVSRDSALILNALRN